MVMTLLLFRCLFVTVQWCVLNPKYVNPKATQTNQNAKKKCEGKPIFRTHRQREAMMQSATVDGATEATELDSGGGRECKGFTYKEL